MNPAEQQRELRRQALETELARLVEVLRGVPGVRRAVVFGSLARGEVRPGSDLDLLVVMRTPLAFLDRLGLLYRQLLPRVELDLLVYTPEELERLIAERPFVRRALSEGREVWCADAA